MRLIHYAVIEKSTGKKVCVSCKEQKCKEVLNTLQNKENYRIGYKWVSI